MTSHIKLLRLFRRSVPVLVAGLALAPVAVVWDSLPAAPAEQTLPTTAGSQAHSSTTLFVVALAGSKLTFRAKVTGVPDGATTPTGSVTFAINALRARSSATASPRTLCRCREDSRRARSRLR